MRKGIALVEVLVVLAVFAMLSVPFARLLTTTLRDIPKAAKIIESNKIMLSALRQIRKDINAAKQFPKDFNDQITDDKTFLIELDDQIICYQFDDGGINRNVLQSKTVKEYEEIAYWAVRGVKLQWEKYEKDAGLCAVNVKAYIEHKTEGRIDKKMENSYLFFVGAYREPID